MQLANDFNAISMNSVTFSDGNIGYVLKPTSDTNKIIEKEKNFISLYSSYISKVIEHFGNKTVRELELSSTIIYIYSNYSYNNWNNSIEDVSESVKRIKPHFTLGLIKDEYKNLDELGLLKKAL